MSNIERPTELVDYENLAALQQIREALRSDIYHPSTSVLTRIDMLVAIVDRLVSIAIINENEKLTPPREPIESRRYGRLRKWLIARALGLRCLVCNRRAGYGGRCRNEEHNG